MAKLVGFLLVIVLAGCAAPERKGFELHPMLFGSRIDIHMVAYVHMPCGGTVVFYKVGSPWEIGEVLSHKDVWLLDGTHPNHLDGFSKIRCPHCRELVFEGAEYRHSLQPRVDRRDILRESNG